MKKILADLTIYRSNIQTIHWKIQGCNFIPIHKFTDKMYEEVNEFIDRVVEKYVQKEVEIDTTLKTLMDNSTLSEETKLNITVDEGIKKLIQDALSILTQVEKAYDDIEGLGSMDLILDDLRDYLEKTIWFLRKSLK
ncbi:ferritin-like domain-containing protein [Mycoplasma todarodis]|uniref:ferritin-like domain-containing protein n=1 Tax=Mycoplasma todarodis TaxID=1937191 RepID=UPI003B2BC10C